MPTLRPRHLPVAVAVAIALGAAQAPAQTASAPTDPSAAYAASRSTLLGGLHRSKLTVTTTTRVAGTTTKQAIAVSEVATGPATFSAGAFQPATLLDSAVRVVGVGTRFYAIEKDGTAYVGTPKPRLEALLAPQSALRLPDPTMLGNHNEVPPTIPGTRRFVADLNTDAARFVVSAMLADDTASALGGAAQIRSAMAQYSIAPADGHIVQSSLILVAAVPEKSLGLIPGLWLTGTPTALNYTLRATFTPTVGGAAVTITAPAKAINLDALAYDQEAKALLRKGATAMENYYLVNKTFATATPAKLKLTAPLLVFTTGGNGLAVKSRIGLFGVNGGYGYELRTTSRTGRVFTYRRDALRQIVRTCRTATGKTCGTW